MIWEYIGSWTWVTKCLYHLNWNANDSSWNWNNGTATNITRVWWLIWNWCASFNGTSSLITIPNAAINNMTEWTISVRVKRNTTFVQHPFIDKLQVWVSNRIQFMYEWIGWGWDNKVRRRINDQTLMSSNAITDTTNWINWIWIWKQWVGMRLYQNWRLNNNNTTSTSLPNSSETIYIWHINTTWVYMDWLIDEIIVDNKARTDIDCIKYYTYAKWRFIS